jgi:hypothetical protein
MEIVGDGLSIKAGLSGDHGLSHMNPSPGSDAG